ncbi:MAG TPA: DoxX family protein [Candidatus Macondimonas sp.]|nr:DoxX family protein [Candidatus Macondimonas sp.]
METFTRDVFADVRPVAGRVLIAPLFIGAGLAKFGDIGGTAGYMQAQGMPLAELLVWPAALQELAGGALLLLGWQTRWVALALAAFTALATPIFHGYWRETNPMMAYQQSLHFWKNTALIGGLLFAAAHGPRRLALGGAR